LATRSLTAAVPDEETEKKGRKDLARYKKNPFLEGIVVSTKDKRLTVARGTHLTDKATGEESMVTNIAQVKRVDDASFVKIFSGQIKLYFDLSAPGFKVFGLVLTAMQQSIGADRIFMTYEAAQKAALEMGQSLSRSTFDRGVLNLCEKKIIALTELSGWFFINPAIIFSGDRARFITEYRKVSAEEARQTMLPGFSGDFEPPF
jgi:hypothetical protein